MKHGVQILTFGTLASFLAVAGLAGFLAFPGTAVAQAKKVQEVTRGKSGVLLTLSGQVNRLTWAADDGTESNWFHADNENSSTRWRLIGKGKIDEEWSVGTLIEQDIQTNSSSANFIQQKTSSGAADSVSFDNRHMLFYVDNKRLGRFIFGRGNMASNNIVQIDLSGTTVIEYSGLRDIGASLKFRTEGFGPGSDGPTVGSVYSQFDGLSRRQRIEYQTPRVAGFAVWIAHGQGDLWDVAIRYWANFKEAGLKVAAGAAFWSFGKASSTFSEGFGGSFSVLHSSGVNVTFATASQNREDVSPLEDPFSLFIKGGWQLKVVPIGKTNISVHYGRADDLVANDDEFTSWGLAVVQNIDKVATELFIFFRQYDLDRAAGGGNFEKLNMGGVGGRVKF